MLKLLKTQMISDQAAIALSGLCVLHCLAVPLSFIFGPVLGVNLAGDEFAHEFLFTLAIPISIIGLVLGFRQHRKLGFFASASVGLGLMYAGLLQDSQVAETFLTLAGVILVALSHLSNKRAAYTASA